jgi:ferredoxin
MATLRILGNPEPIVVQPGKNLLEALQAIQYPIATSCGGRASCGLCRLTILRGAQFLNPINAQELGHLGNVAKVIGIRLACQAIVQSEGEIEIEIPAVEDVAARKRAKNRRTAPANRPSTHANFEDQGRNIPPAQIPLERVEWRPRKLGTPEGNK